MQKYPSMHEVLGLIQILKRNQHGTIEPWQFHLDNIKTKQHKQNYPVLCRDVFLDNKNGTEKKKKLITMEVSYF